MQGIGQLEYTGTLKQLYLFAGIISKLPIEEMISALEASIAYGWVADPTLYRDKLDAAREDLSLLKAMREIQKLMKSHNPQKET